MYKVGDILVVENDFSDHRTYYMIINTRTPHRYHVIHLLDGFKTQLGKSFAKKYAKKVA